MTKARENHCEHECRCGDYEMELEKGLEHLKLPCDSYNCEDDTRTNPSASAERVLEVIREFLASIQCGDCPHGREMNDDVCENYGIKYESTDPCLLCKFDAALASLGQKKRGDEG